MQSLGGRANSSLAQGAQQKQRQQRRRSGSTACHASARTRTAATRSVPLAQLAIRHPHTHTNKQQRRLATALRALPPGAVGAPAAEEQLATTAQLVSWLTAAKGMAPPLVEPKRFKGAAGTVGGDRVGFVVSKDTQAGTTLVALPESVAITSIDAEKHPLVGEAAKECSELVALALWLMAERAAGGASAYGPLLAALPHATESPILWDDKERAELLQVRFACVGC